MSDLSLPARKICRKSRRIHLHEIGGIKARLAGLAGLLFLLLLSTSLSLSHAADGEPVSKSRFGGVAIGGHDPVAYQQLQREPQGPAVEGSKQYTVEYKGAKWHFASQESSELFAADPTLYTPAYNGFCANALSLGEGLVRTDGTHWEILADKLYLFYSAKGRERWTDGNWKSYKLEADAAWEKLSR